MHCDTIARAMAGEDLSQDLPKGHIDIPKLKRGGVDLQVFACFAPPPSSEPEKGRSANGVFAQIEAVNALVEKNPRRPGPGPVASRTRARRGTTARPAFSSGSRAATPSRDDLVLLREFYRAGVQADDPDPLDRDGLGRRLGRPQARPRRADRVRREGRRRDEQAGHDHRRLPRPRRDLLGRPAPVQGARRRLPLLLPGPGPASPQPERRDAQGPGREGRRRRHQLLAGLPGRRATRRSKRPFSNGRRPSTACPPTGPRSSRPLPPSARAFMRISGSAGRSSRRRSPPSTSGRSSIISTMSSR